MNYNQQTEFLAVNCITLTEPKRRTVEEAVSRRQCTVKYFLQSQDGSKVRVCLKSFCDIFSISPRRMQVLVQKLKNKESDITDQRGQHKNRPHSLTNNTKNLIIDHISSFPNQESHYSRAKTSKKYLSAELNLTKMYNLFQDKYPEKSVSKRTYTDIFYSDFKLSFGLPRSDTCDTCDKFFNKMCSASSSEETDIIVKESAIHHMKAEAAYESLRQDQAAAKVNPNLVVLFTDLQQVLYCPTVTHSSAFYQRQYSSYNYAIHEAKTNEAYMMLWHETIGHRGSTEIASCLLRYIVEKFAPLKFGEERKLIVWSDRCVGQNNNWRMIILFQLLILSRYFSQINQKFLATGHSFLPCDRDFALIERQKKTAVVHEPFEWTHVFTSARPKNPFKVVYMDQDDFKDFSAAENNLNKEELKVTKYLWFRIDSDDPMCVKVRESHNILRPMITISLTKSQEPEPGRKKRGRKPVKPIKENIKNINELKPMYSGPLPISSLKKENLLDMCQYLPPEKRSFYENLKT